MSHPESTPPPVNLPDLDSLFAALADGVISDADFAVLQDRLACDRNARDAFRTWMNMETALAWDLAPEEPALMLKDLARATAGGYRRRRPFDGFAASFLAPLTMLIGGAIAAACFFWLGVQKGPAEFATLIEASDDAKWVGAPLSPTTSTLQAGPLGLARGSAMVRFSTGAMVALNAPADIELLGPNRLFLRRGNIVPFVPPSATGFTVVSPSGEVIDLGTEFSVSVDRSGRTDVYVIDGEVDVAGGHGAPHEHQRLTQGFASRLEAASEKPIALTEQVLVLDAFDAQQSSPRPQDPLTLRWRNIDRDAPAEQRDGGLRVPIICREGRNYPPIARVVLDHDFNPLVGRRSRITCKVMLPNVGTAPPDRWAGVAIDAKTKTPQMAYSADIEAAVLVSPRFQSLVLIKGEKVARSRVFSRAEDAIGPYQFVLEIDDTPETRAVRGGATLDVIVNGREILSDRMIALGEQPRVILQTNTRDEGGGRGFAVFDDFCVSVEGPAVPDASSP